MVEHDREIMLQSDHLIDLGPGAGEKGGEVVFNGKINDIKKIRSITSVSYTHLTLPTTPYV